MPMQRHLYPPDWDRISREARQRAGNKCEECGIANHAVIVRSTIDKERYLIFNYEEGAYYTPEGEPIRLSELPDEFEDGRDIEIVLTVAHINHDPSDCRPENLKVLCQLHHNRMDAKIRSQHARERRLAYHRERREASGQGTLL